MPGAALSNHPDVDKVAFTGSTTTGKEILKASVATLKHVSLELGGKSPHIIFADSDLEGALNYAAIGIFGNTGQACIAGSRIFVQEKIHDQFVEGLVKRAEQHKLGAQFEPGTTMGPVVSKVQHQRVLGYINAGKEEGAHTATGGGPGPQPKGYFVQPTVFTGVRNDMKIAREEIFGPVAAVLPFKDENDAVFQGNDTTYGSGGRNLDPRHQPRTQGGAPAEGRDGVDQLLHGAGLRDAVWRLQAVGARTRVQQPFDRYVHPG